MNKLCIILHVTFVDVNELCIRMWIDIAEVVSYFLATGCVRHEPDSACRLLWIMQLKFPCASRHRLYFLYFPFLFFPMASSLFSLTVIEDVAALKSNWFWVSIACDKLFLSWITSLMRNQIELTTHHYLEVDITNWSRKPMFWIILDNFDQRTVGNRVIHFSWMNDQNVIITLRQLFL